MNKKRIGFILILVMLLSYQLAFAIEPIPKAEPENYCKDPDSWAERNAIDLFDRALNTVLQKKLTEQNKTNPNL